MDWMISEVAFFYKTYSKAGLFGSGTSCTDQTVLKINTKKDAR